MIKNTKKYRK